MQVKLIQYMIIETTGVSFELFFLTNGDLFLFAGATNA